MRLMEAIFLVDIHQIQTKIFLFWMNNSSAFHLKLYNSCLFSSLFLALSNKEKLN
jgi:hypothetical protein